MRYTLNVAMLALAAVLAGVPAFAAADTVGKLAENTASDHVSFCPWRAHSHRRLIRNAEH